MSLSLMSHVEFKKCPCRRVVFRGQWPHLRGDGSEALSGNVTHRSLLVHAIRDRALRIDNGDLEYMCTLLYVFSDI